MPESVPSCPSCESPFGVVLEAVDVDSSRNCYFCHECDEEWTERM